MDDGSEEEGMGMFAEPEEYFQEEDTTFRTSTYTRKGAANDELQIRLVPTHALWGHLLWNASIRLADHFDLQPELVRGKRVLELGAGGALPSLVAALNGARSVVISDYPDEVLLDNIGFNASHNLQSRGVDDGKWTVTGYIWGQDAAPLLKSVPFSGLDDVGAEEKFDVIVLSDVICNHGQHENLLKTCISSLSDDETKKPCVYVSFSPHRPQLLEKDLAFFALAKSDEYGFHVSEMGESKMDSVMFEDDAYLGQEELRRTVYMYRMTRGATQKDGHEHKEQKNEHKQQEAEDEDAEAARQRRFMESNLRARGRAQAYIQQQNNKRDQNLASAGVSRDQMSGWVEEHQMMMAAGMRGGEGEEAGQTAAAAPPSPPKSAAE